MKWIDATKELPKDTGWYRVKTNIGFEGETPFIRNFKGDLVWLTLNDKIKITHWQKNES